MPRIRLAYWHGDHQPGDVIDVSDEDLAGLTRDGRVAEVIEAPADEQLVPQQEGEPQPESAPETGRKRR
jgi:hypothetical protein